jgi:hypothetical protein
MSKGLKWGLMSAIVFAAGCVYLTSTSSNASTNSARPSVVTSGEMKKAPTDDQLARRTRRLVRRVNRRTT